MTPMATSATASTPTFGEAAASAAATPEPPIDNATIRREPRRSAACPAGTAIAA